MKLFCPYCEKEIDDPDDCYEAGENYEHKCRYCKKNFVFTVEYSRDYFSKQADCLNGGEHQFEKHKCYGMYGAEEIERCKACGEEKV
jgi:hypothetical protein